MRNCRKTMKPASTIQGRLTFNNVVLEKHEVATIVFLLSLEKDIEMIPASNTPHNRHPDFLMDGLEWEMKSPERAIPLVAERAFSKALRQSSNVVIDLRRAKGQKEKTITHLLKCFQTSKRVRRLLIITKQHGLLDLKK